MLSCAGALGIEPSSACIQTAMYHSAYVCASSEPKPTPAVLQPAGNTCSLFLCVSFVSGCASGTASIAACHPGEQGRQTAPFCKWGPYCDFMSLWLPFLGRCFSHLQVGFGTIFSAPIGALKWPKSAKIKSSKNPSRFFFTTFFFIYELQYP